MTQSLEGLDVLSVTEAVQKGVSSIIRDAHSGHDIVIEKHGHPMAVVVSVDRFTEIKSLEEDLRSVLLISSRMATDDGARLSLNAVCESLGFDLAELEKELDNDIAAGRV